PERIADVSLQLRHGFRRQVDAERWQGEGICQRTTQSSAQYASDHGAGNVLIRRKIRSPAGARLQARLQGLSEVRYRRDGRVRRGRVDRTVRGQADVEAHVSRMA